MVDSVVEQELRRRLADLPAHQQRKVLDYARSLSAPRPAGVPGRSLLVFAGSIPDDDAAEMKKAIDADCEKIDADDW